MEKKRVKRFTYEGLGFPIILIDVLLVKVRDIWTPAIDYNKLQKTVLLALSHKPFPLSGYEVHFIRAYFEMTLEAFGKNFGVTHVAVINWEKTKNKPAKINPAVELFIRLFILEKLKINNQVFRDTFREFDIQRISKERKTLFEHPKPLLLRTENFAKRASLCA
jgi:DNA-binding transcriptional regulator YiaG